MGIIALNVFFNTDATDSSPEDEGVTFVAGKLITGKVIFVLDTKEVVNVVTIKLKGETVIKWNGKYIDKRESLNKLNVVKRIFKIEQCLINKESIALPPGEHNYPFAIMIPHNAPPSFIDEYGGIFYYAKAVIRILSGVDAKKRIPMQIRNLINLNNHPLLRKPVTIEKTKKFRQYRCRRTGSLTMKARLPKTGFLRTDSIPLILEIDKRGKVPNSSVVVDLIQKMRWKVGPHFHEKLNILKTVDFGIVNVNVSRIWISNIILPPTELPCIKHQDIINVHYEVQVKTTFEGTTNELLIPIPITIGDLPFKSGTLEEGVVMALSATATDKVITPPSPPPISSASRRNTLIQPQQSQDMPFIFTSLLTISETKSETYQLPILEYI